MTDPLDQHPADLPVAPSIPGATSALPVTAGPAAAPTSAPADGRASRRSAARGGADAAPGSRRARQDGRRSRRLGLWVLALVVVTAVAGVAFIGLSALNRSRSARADLDAAVELMDRAEDDLGIVDEAIQTEITSELATRALEAKPLAAQVRADANAAIALIEGAKAELPTDETPLADAFLQSAEARAEMMAEAPAILEADIKAAQALAPADQAVAEIKTAEELSAKAVAAFNKHTKPGVQESTSFTNQAETHLKAARSLLATATAAFPEADFSAFTAYIDAKLALVNDSRAIDSLWLAGKIEDSNRKLGTYNTKDAQIVAMARALPASVRDPIANAYDGLTAEATDRYFAARERARAADQTIEELRTAPTEK